MPWSHSTASTSGEGRVPAKTHLSDSLGGEVDDGAGDSLVSLDRGSSNGDRPDGPPA